MYGGSIWFILPLVIGPMVGVVGTTFGAWLTVRANRRTTSGSVETSNASELWTENNRIQDRLRADIDRLRKDVDDLRAEVVAVRLERDQLMRENSELRIKVHDLELEMVRLRTGQAMPAVTGGTFSSAAVPPAEPEAPSG